MPTVFEYLKHAKHLYGSQIIGADRMRIDLKLQDRIYKSEETFSQRWVPRLLHTVITDDSRSVYI